LATVFVFFLIGCGGTDSTSSYYCDTNEAECLESIDVVDITYIDFCSREESAICTQHGQGESILNNTASSIFQLLNSHFTFEEDIVQYGVDDYWYANTDVNQSLVGDHEDKCITYINDLIYKGYDPGSINMIASGTGAEVKHYYVVINGLVYNKIVSYDDIFYMNMASVGAWRLMEQ